MIHNLENIKIFSGKRYKELSQNICDHLAITLGKSNTKTFPDGELIVNIEEDIRGRDCYVVLSTSPPVNENFMELCIFADTLRRASAGRICAVIPYFGYARQDRKETGRTPITAKLCANMLVTAGLDRIIFVDLHSAQIQGFFDIPVDHLAASKIIFDYLKTIREDLGDLVILSPDVGNIKVADGFVRALDSDIAIIDKRRVSENDSVIKNIIGNVSNKNVIMVDDMISTAGTMCNAAEVAKELGAKKIIAIATHAVFSGNAIPRLCLSPIEQIIITDSISNISYGELQSKIKILSIAELLAKAIKHIHNNQSVSALFEDCLCIKR